MVLIQQAWRGPKEGEEEKKEEPAEGLSGAHVVAIASSTTPRTNRLRKKTRMD